MFSRNLLREIQTCDVFACETKRLPFNAPSVVRVARIFVHDEAPGDFDEDDSRESISREHEQRDGAPLKLNE